MNKKYPAKLAAYTVMFAALYLPQGQAYATFYTDGEVMLPVTNQLVLEDASVNATVAGGTTFEDIFKFSVSHNAILKDTDSSVLEYVAGGTRGINNFSIGIELTKVQLVDITTGKITQLTQSLSAPSKIGPYTAITDTYTLAPYYLKTSDTYELQVYGTIGNTTAASSHGSYADNFTVTSVPEPEQWGMLLLGLPFIGWVARHKQNWNVYGYHSQTHSAYA